MTQVIRFAKSGARSAPTLPLDAITRTFGIFGVKDSGKTTTARVLVEGICKAGGNVALLDPVGVWWGATRAGEGPGIPGIVIGGEHGDVPLEKTGGQLVAELCVARAYPLVVVDLKLLRKGEAQHFMADFLEGVYFANRRPLMLVFEEADRALPQNPRGMDPTLGRVMGAAEDIVKLGRSRGLGSTFISQRFATVTKNVTEQIEALFLHRQVGPNDRKAVKAWIESNGDPTTTATVLDSMASLEQGEAWLYSPGWLRMLERVRMRYPKTLDSSATPSNEEAEQQEAAKRAPVNLDELRTMMAETVERAAANDPKVLKKRIADLEAEVERVREERPPAEPVEPERIMVPDREALAGMIEAVSDARATLDGLDDLRRHFAQVMGESVEGIEKASMGFEQARERAMVAYEAMAKLPREGATMAPPSASRSAPRAAAARAERSTPAASSPAAAPESNGALSLRAGERAMLAALIEYPEALTLARWGALSYRHGTSKPLSPSGSTFKTYHRVLRRHGLVEDGEPVRITDAGREALANHPPELVTEEQVLEAWMGLLREGERNILTAVRSTTRWIEKEDVAEQVGLPASGSTFKTYVRVLARLELVENSTDELRGMLLV